MYKVFCFVLVTLIAHLAAVSAQGQQVVEQEKAKQPQRERYFFVAMSAFVNGQPVFAHFDCATNNGSVPRMADLAAAGAQSILKTHGECKNLLILSISEFKSRKELEQFLGRPAVQAAPLIQTRFQ
jgi:hypothetical protein